MLVYISTRCTGLENRRFSHIHVNPQYKNLKTMSITKSPAAATLHEEGPALDPQNQHSRTDVELGMSGRVKSPGVVEEIASRESETLASESKKSGKTGWFYKKYKIFVHSFFFLLVTG